MPIQYGSPSLPLPAAKPRPKPVAAPPPAQSAYAPPPAAAPQAQAQAAAPVAQALASNPFETDPGYLAALAAEQAGSQQADDALKAAREAAIVQFGDPSLAQAAGFDLDPLTAAMAQQNTQAGNSTLAQLQHTRDLNQQGIVNSLAAHGIIRSGDLGYKTGQNEQNYGTSLYNAQQGVLGNLNALQANDLAAKQGLRSATTSALTGAYSAYVANPALWGAATVNDGGQQAAANAAATAPATAPVTAALARPKPPAGVSRLQSQIAVNPRAGQVARNSY